MKPFLKWAGNKYQIIDHIKALLPQGNRLIEPFIGSGAVFVNTDYPSYLLTDSNIDLIKTYQYLQQEGKEFIDYCQQFFTAEYNDEKAFYELRLQFNATQNSRLKSALFIYLNKHCFNGLCRYNSKGEFNTPFGKYKKPYFPAKEMYYFHSKSQTALFKQADFHTTMLAAEPGDIIYCDPPYVPLSKTASFTSYSSNEFGLEQQKQLAKLAIELTKKGIPVIISNHDTEFIREIYQQAKIQLLEVQRYISCNGNNRRKVREVLAVFS